MDIVFIEQLSVITTIGVYDWEQKIEQKLVLDIEMGWDNKRASRSDNVTDCLDYAQISQAIMDHVSKNKFGLVERVAEEVAQLLLGHFVALGYALKLLSQAQLCGRKVWVLLLKEALDPLKTEKKDRAVYRRQLSVRH